MKKISITIALLSLPLLANIQLSNNGFPSLTITNKITSVKEDFSFSIQDSNSSSFYYSNFPSNTVPDSIFSRLNNDDFPEDDIAIISSSFHKKNMNTSSLLSSFIGKKIQYKIHSNEDSYIPIVSLGTLVSVYPLLITPVGSDKTFFVKQEDLIFPSIPSDLISTPTMSWKTNPLEVGKYTLTAKYLINNIQWKSRYSLSFSSDTTGILSSFIDIYNNTNKSFINADVKCLAGNINYQKTSVPRIYKHRSMESPVAMDSISGISISAIPSNGFHVYSIPNKIDIWKNSTTNAVVFKSNVLLKKSLSASYNIQSLFFGNRKQFDIKFAQLATISAMDLNKPLPSGKVYIYDQTNKNMFLGTHSLANTPKNKDAIINYGENFDVTGKVSILDFDKERYVYNPTSSKNRFNGWKYSGTYKISILNSSDKKHIIKLDLTNGFTPRNFISSSNCDDGCESGFDFKGTYYKFTIPANSKFEITSRFDIFQ